MTVSELLKRAKAAKGEVSSLTTEEKNKAIYLMAQSFEENTEKILKANREDIERAKGKIGDVMIDRLRLTEERIKDMADGMRKVADLPDPCGEVLERILRPNGLEVFKTAVPIGVVAIIYESRPNVTSDAAVLSFKSGNVCVLRGGKEAYSSATAIVSALKEGLLKSGITEDAVNIVSDTTRESATLLMTATGMVDLLIPRGGKGLIDACVKNATVPCIQTGTGICHIYVDKDADLDMAADIIENAKKSRPSVCNACEVVLVHKDIAKEFLPALKKRITDTDQNPVELRTDERAFEIIGGKRAEDKDFDTEFLDYILAVSVVDSKEDAVKHISLHSTGHSEAIITSDEKAAEFFTKSVDSAAVYVNASTRFTDGGEFGLGCEMGISTQKMHARGPMGLRELTTYKYIVRGSGQVR